MFHRHVQLMGWVSGLAIATMVAANPANAQDGQAAAQPSDASSPAADDAASGQVGEIVVTAQRRDERLQDVPIAISAISASAAQSAGVTTTESLSNAVPSLQFSRQIANGGVPFIRGVGSTTAAAGFESPVAVYVDDVYISAPSATTMGFNNIERVEVLRGPQGTLFGRNATGGVVHVITRRPNQDASFDASVGYSRFNTVDASIYATGGLSDKVAMSVAGVVHNQGQGYGLDVTTGADVYRDEYRGGRVELALDPSSTTHVLLIGDYTESKGDLGLNATINPGTVATGGGTYPGLFRTRATPADTGNASQWGVSGRIDQDFDSVKLTNITAYRKAKNRYQLDLDGSPANIVYGDLATDVPTFQEELRLASAGTSPFQWIVGGMYFTANTHVAQLSSGLSTAATGGQLNTFVRQKLTSYAGFGEASYDFGPFKLTGGLRYTSDKYDLDVVRKNAGGVVLAPTPFSRNSTFEKLTYRAVLDYHFTRDVMAYASYSRGFHSGGYNASAPTLVSGGVTVIAPPIQPEVIDAYEIGLKSELFDRRLRLNLSAFHYNYKNMQVTVVGIAQQTILNAAAAKMDGVDVDFELAPLRGLTLRGGVSYLNARFASFPNGPYLIANPATCSPTPQTTGTPTGGYATCSVDLSGKDTPRAPTFSGSFSGTYSFDTSLGNFALTAAVYHNSGYAWDADNVVRQPDYTTLASTLSWMSTDKHLEVRIWGKNLTDAYYGIYAGQSPLKSSVVPAMPRTYGGTLAVHF